MARHYKKHSGKKRGLKKGHKKSAAWRKAISAGLKRAWKAGKFRGRKHRGGKRRAHTKRKAHQTGRRRSSRNRTITRKKRSISIDFHPRKSRRRRAKRA